jgi:hypothetical protein
MPAKPLKMVMIRRGNTKVSDVPSENLVTFIRKNILFGTDELSGDGKSWIRVDRHYQLRKYFSSDEKEKDLSAVQEISASYNLAHLNPPRGLKDDLEKMVSLLKDING